MHDFPEINIKYRQDATIKITKVTSMKEMVVRFTGTFLASRTL